MRGALRSRHSFGEFSQTYPVRRPGPAGCYDSVSIVLKIQPHYNIGALMNASQGFIVNGPTSQRTYKPSPEPLDSPMRRSNRL